MRPAKTRSRSEREASRQAPHSSAPAVRTSPRGYRHLQIARGVCQYLLFALPHRQDGRTLVNALESRFRLGNGLDPNYPPDWRRVAAQRDLHALPLVNKNEIRRNHFPSEAQPVTRLVGQEISVRRIASQQVEDHFEAQGERGASGTIHGKGGPALDSPHFSRDFCGQGLENFEFL